MNIHFTQVERKSQSFTYLLVAFATSTVLMLVLSLSRQVEIHFSVPAISIQAVQPVNRDLPVAIRAPISPTAGSAIATTTPQSAGNIVVTLVHQPIPAPMPSVP